MGIHYKRMTESDFKYLESIVGSENVLTDPADLVCYSRDKSMTKRSEWFKLRPKVVVLPASTEEVLEIVRYANREKIPITPRGGGTSFTGNAVPSYGGIVVDLKRMDKIIEIDEDNLMVTAQAGIQVQTLDTELRKHGLMYPDEPTSFPSATLGGRISTRGISYMNSRYGDTHDLVIGLEVVLPYGKVIRVGEGGAYKMAKSAVGYPLKYLFCGHWGTLGIITEAVMRVFPIPEAIEMREFAFDDIRQAFKTAIRLYKTGIRFALLSVNNKYRPMLAKKLNPNAPETESLLSVVLMGPKEEVAGVLPRVMKICLEMGGKDLGPASEHYETRWEFDTAFPGIAYKLGLGPGNWQCDEHGFLATIGPEMFEKFLQIIKKYNIHEDEIYTLQYFSLFPKPAVVTMYRFDECAEDRWSNYQALARELMDEVLKVGGTVSVCHGLGMRRCDEYVSKELGPAFELMKKIKKVLDPNNIMNPGKMMLDTAYE
jgi:glycolate oxidase